MVEKTKTYNKFKTTPDDPKSDVFYRDTAYSCTEEILNMDGVTSDQLTNLVNKYLSELRKDDTIELQFWPIIDNKGIGLGDAIALAFTKNIRVFDTWGGKEANSQEFHNFLSNPESPNDKILIFRDRSGRYHQISK